jgi:hypothetical protein
MFVTGMEHHADLEFDIERNKGEQKDRLNECIQSFTSDPAILHRPPKQGTRLPQ